MSDDSKNERFPFPNARVVRLIKSEAGEKMISSKVKMATNQFLADVCEIVATEMDETSEKTVQMEDFVRAARPYTLANRLDEEHEAVVSELERMRIRMDKLIRDFRREFDLVDENDFKVGHEEEARSSVEAAPVEEKKKGPSLADLSDDELGF